MSRSEAVDPTYKAILDSPNPSVMVTRGGVGVEAYVVSGCLEPTRISRFMSRGLSPLPLAELGIDFPLGYIEVQVLNEPRVPHDTD